jgi:hypothetical protein
VEALLHFLHPWLLAQLLQLDLTKLTVHRFKRPKCVHGGNATRWRLTKKSLWYGIIIIIWDIWYLTISPTTSVYSNQSTILRIWWYDIWYVIHDTWYMIHDTWYMIHDIWYGIWDMIKHISPWRIWDVQRISLREYLPETMDENIRGSCPFSLKPILGDVEREWNGCYWNIQLGKWW